MFRGFNALADRPVELVAPKATAAAGCSPTKYKKSCGYCTSSGLLYAKTCQLDYYCHETCGGCSVSSTRC